MRQTAILSAVLLVLSGPLALANDHDHDHDQSRRQLSVDGQASRSVTPDQANLSLSIQGRAPQSGKAMTLAGKAAQAVVATLTKFLDAQQVRASQTQVRSVVKGTDHQWRRDSSEAMEMLASRNIDAERIPVEKLAALMDALAAHKLATINQVTLRVSNAAEIENALSLLAIDDAKTRALNMAQRLNVGLGLPISVQSHQSQSPQPQYAMRAMAMEAGAGGGYQATGENQITARVSIVFELEAP
jgi:uncharacterized protein YggE